MEPDLSYAGILDQKKVAGTQILQCISKTAASRRGHVANVRNGRSSISYNVIIRFQKQRKKINCKGLRI